MSKVQIKLNYQINNHKASLKLYDGIVDFLNDNVLSSNFDKYAWSKSRKSFIQSMERIYHWTHLRLKHRNFIFHNSAEVTVPVFDAKPILLDLLTNPFTMDKANMAEGYDMLTSDVEETHMA